MKVQVNKGSGQVTVCIPKSTAIAFGYIDQNGNDLAAEVSPMISARGNLELVKLEKVLEAKE